MQAAQLSGACGNPAAQFWGRLVPSWQWQLDDLVLFTHQQDTSQLPQVR
jgi:hypothetical protein